MLWQAVHVANLYSCARDTNLQSSYVSYHHGEQSVAGNVEGNSQPHICRPLIQLTRQLPIGHIELYETMAGWQGHGTQICDTYR